MLMEFYYYAKSVKQAVDGADLECLQQEIEHIADLDETGKNMLYEMIDEKREMLEAA